MIHLLTQNDMIPGDLQQFFTSHDEFQGEPEGSTARKIELL